MEPVAYWGTSASPDSGRTQKLRDAPVPSAVFDNIYERTGIRSAVTTSRARRTPCLPFWNKNFLFPFPEPEIVVTWVIYDTAPIDSFYRYTFLCIALRECSNSIVANKVVSRVHKGSSGKLHEHSVARSSGSSLQYELPKTKWPTRPPGQ